MVGHCRLVSDSAVVLCLWSEQRRQPDAADRSTTIVAPGRWNRLNAVYLGLGPPTIRL